MSTFLLTIGIVAIYSIYLVFYKPKRKVKKTYQLDEFEDKIS